MRPSGGTLLQAQENRLNMVGVGPEVLQTLRLAKCLPERHRVVGGYTQFTSSLAVSMECNLDSIDCITLCSTSP